MTNSLISFAKYYSGNPSSQDETLGEEQTLAKSFRIHFQSNGANLINMKS